MASVLDIAKYVLERQGSMTTLKLQKLVYFAQAWSTAWRNEDLFGETIKAWAQGPVVPELFLEHRSKKYIDKSMVSGDSSRLAAAEKAVVDQVVDFYGHMPPAYLSALTHFDAPWRDARETGYKSPKISRKSIEDYYRGKSPDEVEADFQRAEARKIMDQHRVALERLSK